MSRSGAWCERARRVPRGVCAALSRAPSPCSEWLDLGAQRRYHTLVLGDRANVTRSASATRYPIPGWLFSVAWIYVPCCGATSSLRRRRANSISKTCRCPAKLSATLAHRTPFGLGGSGGSRGSTIAHDSSLASCCTPAASSSSGPGSVRANKSITYLTLANDSRTLLVSVRWRPGRSDPLRPRTWE